VGGWFDLLNSGRKFGCERSDAALKGRGRAANAPWGHCHVKDGNRCAGMIRGVTSAAPSYKRHRYPVEIIDHCVWLYFRFTLSFREVE
jgi:hypothetical protein